MQIYATTLCGVLLIEPKVFGDTRGFFQETFQAERYAAAGIALPFVQDNLSFSRRGVLRGLHFQSPNPQGKLIYVLQGEVFDVTVDIRYGSPTFGQWYGVLLSGENHRQVWIPPGCAHGFCVVSETALFAYKCTAFYDPSSEATLLWNDPMIGVQWPIQTPQLSHKDAQATLLRDLDVTRLLPFDRSIAGAK